MRRAGFSLLEVLMVIGILGVVSTATIPMYRSYQIRNDLNVATEQVTQGLARARLLAQSAKDDAGWGFYVPNGTLYKGDSYAGRDTTYDEVYSMPSTIDFSGLTEVAYSKTKGQPSATGSIILTAIDQETRTIQISVDQQNVAVVVGDNITICHNPGPNQVTITINDNAWPAHQKQGDTLGACPQTSSASQTSSAASQTSSTSAVSSSASSVLSSSISSVSSVSGGGGTGSSSSVACTDRFSVSDDGTITTSGPLSIEFDDLGAQFGYGNGGPDVPVYVSYAQEGSSSSQSGWWWRHNSGTTWISLFNGQAINGTGGATQTVTGFKTGDKVAVKFHASYSNHGWLSFDDSVESDDKTGSVKILRNGDSAPTIPGSTGQESVSDLIKSVTVNGKISIGQYDLLLLADFNYLQCHTCSAADFQDGVVLVKFQAPTCN
ncbi:MAG TPA: type II secretion system protein [Candidatus Peribacteraceae bacterium]|nr:type II secretion system protein [Candidatus Peribacteraceae bacterium]